MTSCTAGGMASISGVMSPRILWASLSRSRSSLSRFWVRSACRWRFLRYAVQLSPGRCQGRIPLGCWRTAADLGLEIEKRGLRHWAGCLTTELDQIGCGLGPAFRQTSAVTANGPGPGNATDHYRTRPFDAQCASRSSRRIWE